MKGSTVIAQSIHHECKDVLQAFAGLVECFSCRSKMEPSHIRSLQYMWHIHYKSHFRLS